MELSSSWKSYCYLICLIQGLGIKLWNFTTYLLSKWYSMQFIKKGFVSLVIQYKLIIMQL